MESVVVRHRKLKERARPDSEITVSRSLDRLAGLLLRLGLDAPRAEQLLRQSFVKAARVIASSGGRNFTQSQIAALAGVSRREVREHVPTVERQDRVKNSKKKSESRIERLVKGWTTDPVFSRLGAPRLLSYRGADSEFELLVKKYGRDVTKKSLKNHLATLGLIVERKGKLALVRGRLSETRLAAAFADLRFLESQLEHIDFDLAHRQYATKRIALAAKERKSAEALRQIALTRLDTVLSALQSLSPRTSFTKGHIHRENHRVIVSTTVALENRRAGE